MKLKDFSSLGTIYENIAKGEVNEQEQNAYLTEEKAVKAGSPLGGGPGTKGDEVHLAKKTGPEGLKGNNFEKVSKKQDPGANPAKMNKQAEDETAEHTEDTTKKSDELKGAKENEQEDDAAKNTTPKEKVRESLRESNKYNYKPKFTMSKLKFDQLYEDAIKRIPFTEEAEADMDAGADDAPVPPADDVAADADMDMGDDLGGEEVTITLDRASAQKLHDVLMSALGGGADDIGTDLDDTAGGDLGDEMEESEPPIEEEVETKPADKSEMLHDKDKMKTAGDLKAVKGTADKGAPKSEPEPKELGDKSGPLKGKSNKVGSGTVASPGKKAFE